MEIRERGKPLKEASCMTKHFLEIVHSLAAPAAGSSLCGFINRAGLERSAGRVNSVTAMGHLFACDAFFSIMVTIPLFHPDIFVSLLMTSYEEKPPWFFSNLDSFKSEHAV